MADKKEYVKLWVSYAAYFEALSDAEVGRLARAMMKYKSSGATPKFSGNERFVWPAIQRDIDEANDAQAALSDQNRENAKRRWNKRMQTDATACDIMRTDAKNAMDKGLRTKVKDKGQGQGQLDRTPACDPAVAAVVSDYMNRINPSASRYSLEMLTEYAKTLGPDVCKRAFDIALDAKAANWNYIRAILQKWASLGVKCLADIDKLDKKRSGRTSDGKRELDDDEVAAIQRMMSGGDGG